MIALAALLLTAPPWTPLFDGKTLNGWEQRGGKAVYSMESGVVVGRTVVGTPNSFLCTKRAYGDFELEFEVWVDPKLNSGVQIRSASVPGYQEGRVHGYQVEIDPSERAWSGGLYDESRRGWLQDLSKNPRGQKAFRNGQWNKYRIVATGDHLQTWVNGVPVTDFHDDLSRSGFIALQVHNHETSGVVVKWRKLRIKDFGVPGSLPPKGGEWLLRQASDAVLWEPEGKPGTPVGWVWKDGALEVVPGTGDIVTRQKFSDARLHLEFMVDENGKTGQANGNSGVYFMQSYEVQVLNSAPRGPLIDECGAIYGIKAPDYAMAMSPGTWQSYDIWFKAPTWFDTRKVSNARMTVVHNGTVVQRNVEVPGHTGSGRDEGPQARPIRLQDHGCRIRYRNVWVSAPPSD